MGMRSSFKHAEGVESQPLQDETGTKAEVDVDAGRKGSPDAGREKTSKSQKQLDLATFLEVAPSRWLAGMVRFTTFKGAFLDVAHPRGRPIVQGFAQADDLGDFEGSPMDVLDVGQRIRVRVVSVDMRTSRVNVT